MIREVLLKHLAEREAESEGFKQRLLSDLTQGRVTADPFGDETLTRLRLDIGHRLNEQIPGIKVRRGEDEREQAIEVRLLQAFLRAVEDPDWARLNYFCHGIPYGVHQRLPRTPAVFPPKRKWKSLRSKQNGRPRKWLRTG